MHKTIRYTPADAARILGLSERVVRGYCAQAKLGERIGRNFSITDAQLRRFILARQQRSPHLVGRKPKPLPSMDDK